MRRWRAIAAGLTGMVLGAGLAIGGATSASAAPTGHWGTFTVSGSSKAYTGTVTMDGFPATTFTSNSRQSTVISGASTWQSENTPVGLAGFGTSRNQTYMNQRPNADNATSPSTTTYTFAEPAPGAQSWAFVLGDIDADQATISATDVNGNPVSGANLGFGGPDAATGAYNSCSTVVAGGWSCGRPTTDDPTPGTDKPTWTPTATGGTLVGNATASDTAGATAWFSPITALKTLTVSYQQRSGFPVYQTWFAVKTAQISGVATLDGTPIPGATVTVTAPRGVVYTTTTDADGRYTFPELPQINDYVARITAPDGATGTATVSGVSLNTTLAGNDRDDVDFTFTSPPGTAAVIGTVEDTAGNPVANVPVVIIDPQDGTTLVDTTTNSEGVYTGSGLPPSTQLQVSIDGQDPTPITTGAAADTGAAPAQPTSVVPAAEIATVTGLVSLDGAPVAAGRTVELLDSTGAVISSTTTDADGRYTFETVPGTYGVRTTAPVAGATGATTNTGIVAVANETVQSNLAFATPTPPAVVTTTQPGTVTDTDGEPVAGRQVVATPTDPTVGAPVTTTTGTDGRFTLDGLAPATEYTIAVDGADPQTITTPDTGAATALTFTVPAAVVTPTPTPTPTVPPTSGGGTTPVSTGGGVATGGDLAYTGADLTPGLIAAGVLVLLGGGLLTFRAVRNRRRTTHLQD
ncbi:carboxypeptidase regulatory-like domain-containing protein [Curtobacterium flaccumfaciens]|nr:carboxypeptidase regulatory-like domain-containing protein [Curtobacterium flaccumfaciens]